MGIWYHYLGGKEDYQARVMDVDLEINYGLYLNASETGYVNIESADEYERIESVSYTHLSRIR